MDEPQSRRGAHPLGVRPPLRRIQRTAKRPQTNKGGREEEEKRLVIAAGSRRPGRLRSAKTDSATGTIAGLLVTTPGPIKKFQLIATGCAVVALHEGKGTENIEYLPVGLHCD